MPRGALIPLLAVCALAAASVRAATDPHLDRLLVPGGCRACHAGHGASGSPMLPRPQLEVCLACHDSQARADEQIRLGNLAPGAKPPLLGAVLAQTAVHPLTAGAFSRHETDAVTCTSCHSPHRRSTPLAGQGTAGNPRISTRDPRHLEWELCESCHGSAGPLTRSPLDLARQFDPSSRSFHPVHAPAAERSPSVRTALSRRQISCTDCHDGDGRGARGPHGSPWEGLLVANYVTVDGAPESRDTYALCWTCHDRERVLAPESPFPLHRLHVVDEHAACATCHSAHGSIENRALIRFGEETRLGGVSASTSLGRLEFVSDAPRSGTCTLTCHGVDHAERGYGVGARAIQALRARIAPAAGAPAEASAPAGKPTRPPRPPVERIPPR